MEHVDPSANADPPLEVEIVRSAAPPLTFPLIGPLVATRRLR